MLAATILRRLPTNVHQSAVAIAKVVMPQKPHAATVTLVQLATARQLAGIRLSNFIIWRQQRQRPCGSASPAETRARNGWEDVLHAASGTQW